jgi:uncharacterized membrane protein YfcA
MTASLPIGKVVLTGVFGGLLAGVFGVGGGIVMVPLFVLFLGLDQRTAVTTSLLAIIPISILGALGYATGGAVAWGAGLIIGAGSILGGQIGVRLLPRIPVPALQVGFAALLLYSAYELLQPDAAVSASGTGPLWLLIAVGVVAGLLAGLLGIGGGIVIIPGLVLLAGVDLTTARGTSLLVVLITAMTASITTVRAGRANVRVGVWAGLAGAPAALLASLVSQAIPQKQAAWLFAGLMVVAAAQLLRKAWTGRREVTPQSGS